MKLDELKRALTGEALREAVDVERSIQAVLRRGHRYRRRQRVFVAAAGVLTLALVALTAALLWPDASPDQVLTTAPEGDITVAVLSTEPVDAGAGRYASSVALIDPASGSAHVEAVPDNNYGEYPLQLFQIGDRLLFPGGGVVRSAPLDLSAPPVDIAPALVFVPSTRRDRVWTVSEWQVDNTGPYKLTEVDVEGTATTGPIEAPAEANWPIVGTQHGVVLYAQRDQAVVWDPNSDQIVRRIEGVQHFQGNGWATGDMFLWVGPCSTQPRCDLLRVLDLATGAARAIEPPRGSNGFLPDGAVAPDGRMIALFAATASGPQLALVDLESGQSRLVPGSTEGGSGVSWAPDGRVVYFGQDASTTVSSYVLGEASSRRIREGLTAFTALLVIEH